MKRTLALLPALVFLAHCSKSTSTPAAAPPAAPVASPASRAAAPESKPAAAEPEPAGEERKVEITDALVGKYVVYLKESIPARKAALAEYGSEWAKIDKEKGLRQGVDALKSGQKLHKAAEEAEQKARDKAGLSEEEVEALAAVVPDVIMPRMLMKQNGMNAQAAEMEKQMRAAMETLPPEQREQAAKELKEMTQGLKDLHEGKEVREKHGDKAVEAVLKHEAELVALQKQLLGSVNP
jgi:hypothetical protein